MPKRVARPLAERLIGPGDRFDEMPSPCLSLPLERVHFS